MAYDQGEIQTFRDVQLSLHIYVSRSFIDITDADAEMPGQKRAAKVTMIIEAANDLLLWIHEGDDAVIASRQQRATLAAVSASVDSKTDGIQHVIYNL